jgi:hypothetical protein
MTSRIYLTIAILFFFYCFIGENINGQEQKVRVSPKASVMQVVGFTEIQIDYGRPGVKGRKIWGELVPYNRVWRAGANEATVISFSNDVTIEGKNLPAGKYSFFTIPNKDEWVLIFNRAAEQWGAFEYNESQDALRVTVKQQENNFVEWLTYSFSKTGDHSAVINLKWEKLKVPFKVEAK